MRPPEPANSAADRRGSSGDRPLLALDGIEARFAEVVDSPEWREVERAAAAAQTILLFGNGGNLAVAQHGATDLAVLTDKRVIAPGSSVSATAIANEVGFDEWLAQWLQDELRHLPEEARARSLALGLSCSGVSPSVLAALRAARELGVGTALISGRPPAEPLSPPPVVLGAGYYHSAEILMTLLIYQLAIAGGATARRLD